MSTHFRILDPSLPNQQFHHRCAFTVMAKAPVPGQVKTRLSPPLTPEEAAQLNTHFLRDTLASLGAAASSCAAECVISYTPTGQESAFSGIAPEGTLLLAQRGNGFGERLHTTATDLFQCGFSAVCLIDSDSPTVPTKEFVSSAEALLSRIGDPATTTERSRIVLGRSDDGGYYLLGLDAPHPQLFDRIDWSTNVVADQTCERAAEIGLSVIELVPWFDVDDAGSLARLRREFAGVPRTLQGYPAPYTRAFLEKLSLPAESSRAFAAAGSVNIHGRD